VSDTSRYAVLVAIAAVPAVLLAGTWQYADANVPPPTTTTTTTLPPPPADELATDLLSYRRHPAPLAEAAAVAERDAELAALAQQLTEQLGPGACLHMVADDGTTIAELAATTAVIPASTHKAVIAAVALDVLGPDFRFRTELFTDTAPVDGVILSRAVEPGEVALTGGALLVVGDLRNLTVTVYLPEDEYGTVKVGEAARVTVDSFPGRAFSGTVQRIADKGEYTPRNVQTPAGRRAVVFAVKVAVENTGGELKPGMPADIVFAK